MRVKDLRIGEQYATVNGWKMSQYSDDELLKWHSEEVSKFTITRIEKGKPYGAGSDSKQVVYTIYGTFGESSKYERDIQPFQIRMKWAHWLALRGPVAQEEERRKQEAAERERQKRDAEKQVLTELQRFFPFTNYVTGSFFGDSASITLKKDGIQSLIELLEEAWTVREAKKHGWIQMTVREEWEDRLYEEVTVLMDESHDIVESHHDNEICHTCQHEHADDNFEICIECMYTWNERRDKNEQPEHYAPLSGVEWDDLNDGPVLTEVEKIHSNI